MKLFKEVTILLIFLFFIMGIVNSQNTTITINKNQKPEAGKVIRDSMFGFELVYIPAGTIKRDPNYLRKHITTSKLDAFYMGKFEVTQKLWKEIMGDFPIEFNPEDYDYINKTMTEKEFMRRKEISTAKFIEDDLPVTAVSWKVIQQFFNILSEKTGHVYRLPTDEEWEYAYRAGTNTEYYFGNDTLLVADYEWYNENSENKIHKTGLKKPNPWGLFDIGGNVAEWTETIADMMPYTRKYGRQFCMGSRRIYRGSHYLHSKFAANATWTHTYLEVYPHEAVGFRVVREIEK